jgi:hypothetical protein
MTRMHWREASEDCVLLVSFWSVCYIQAAERVDFGIRRRQGNAHITGKSTDRDPHKAFKRYRKFGKCGSMSLRHGYLLQSASLAPMFRGVR